jgi:hypothetical protein
VVRLVLVGVVLGEHGCQGWRGSHATSLCGIV